MNLLVIIDRPIVDDHSLIEKLLIGSIPQITGLVRGKERLGGFFRMVKDVLIGAGQAAGTIQADAGSIPPAMAQDSKHSLQVVLISRAVVQVKNAAESTHNSRCLLRL
jgi:hypothetical protein